MTNRPQTTPPADQARWVHFALCAAVIMAVALAFQGTRGIWEPDEGRYVHGALEMLAGGDWLVPKLHGLIYLDKSPAIHWSLALGVKMLGSNEWGLRLAHALSLIGTAILVGAWVRPALGARASQVAAAAYATTLFPVVAANSVTPDALLALCTTASFVAYWRYRAAEAPGRYLWAAVLGLTLGLGLFTKGTAALIFAAPIVLHLLWELGPLRAIRRWELWLTMLAALGLGSLWYLALDRQAPGALDYLFDNQVSGRLWKSTYQRNTEWWKPLKIYGAAIVFGSLPWSALWVRLSLRQGFRRVRELAVGDALSRFLILATVFPLVVLSLAKSRLELYALPVLAPIVALTLLTVWRSGLPVRWTRILVLSALAMMGIKWAAAGWPTERDSRQMARGLTSLGVDSGDCVDILNEKVHALGFYGFDRVFWHTTREETYPLFEAPRLLEHEIDDLTSPCAGRITLVSQPRHLELAARTLAQRGWICDEQRTLLGIYSLTRCRLGPEATLPGTLASGRSIDGRPPEEPEMDTAQQVVALRRRRS